MADEQKSLKAGYEVREMNTTLMVLGMLILALMLAFGAFGGLIFMRYLEASRPPMNPEQRSPLAATVEQPKKAFLLQQDPEKEKNEVLKKDRQHLESYGMVIDQPELKRAHIPIERAIEMVAAGEVPYRQEPPKAKTGAEGEASTGEDADQETAEKQNQAANAEGAGKEAQAQ